MNVFGVLFSGLGLALLTALAFIAYRHPAGYNRLMHDVPRPIVIGAGIILACYTGFILGGIISLESQVADSADSLPMTVSTLIAKLGFGARVVAYSSVGGLLFLLYLGFLQILPSLLGLEEEVAQPPASP